MMEEMQVLKTVRDWARFASSRFNEAKLCFGHGTDNAWDEALALILHVLHLSHDMSGDLLDARLIMAEKQQILNLIKRRIEERKPLAYLTQKAYFAGLEFYVDEQVLIPRSPIAELIQQKFAPWIGEDQVENILDLCTGSGCIAIACAKYFPYANVDATDISFDALNVAQKNIALHHLRKQIRLIQSNVFSAMQNRRYDIIVSNPPYVGKQEFSELPMEYTHEPKQALLAEEDGLAIVIKILQQADYYLREDGILIVEVGNSQEALAKRFPEVDFMWLDFEHGGEGVFLLTGDQLRQYRGIFNER